VQRAAGKNSDNSEAFPTVGSLCACSGRLTADWREKNPDVEPAEELLKRIREERGRNYEESPKTKTNETKKPRKGKSFNIPSTELDSNGLPHTWIRCKLALLAELITKGASPNWQGINYTDQGILFITSENVGSRHLILENKKYVEERFNVLQKRSILRKGDLLTNIVRASIGRSAIFELDEKANINQAVALIRLNDEVNRNYILNVLNSPDLVEFMHKEKVDVARANLNLEDVSNFPIPLPPLPKQQEIVRRVEALFKIADGIEERYKKARGYVDKLTQSILAKAFRGELVPQDPNDEPASVLLERIREERNKRQDKSQTGKTKNRKRKQAQNRECLFGDVVDGEMRLNEFGKIIESIWLDLPKHYYNIRIQRRRMLIPKMLGHFKMKSAKRINQMRATPGMPVWQRNYYEHIIRNEDKLNEIREYIVGNPIKWAEDENNPVNLCRGTVHRAPTEL